MRHPPGRLRGYHRGPSDRGPYCDTSPSGEPVTYGDACTPTCPAVTSGTQRRYIGRRGAYPSLVKIGLCLSRVTMAFTKRPEPHGDHTRRRPHVDARPALATVTGRRPFLCQAVPHGLSMVTLIRGRRHHVGRTVPALGLLPPAFAHGHGKASARVCSQTPRLRRERNRSCGMTYTRYQRPSIVSAIALVGGCVRTQNRWWSRGHWSGILLLYIEVSLAISFGSPAFLVMRKRLKNRLLKCVRSPQRPTIQGHGYTRNGVVGNGAATLPHLVLQTGSCTANSD